MKYLYAAVFLLFIPGQFNDVDIPPEKTYLYQAEVVEVYDADTATLRVDLGFNITLTERFRLYRINAWEVTGPEKPQGLLAKDFFLQQCPIGSTVWIKTVRNKKGKYGRYLADIYIKTTDNYQCLNDLLVANNHAKYQEY
jgi:micrococcal nuclease